MKVNEIKLIQINATSGKYITQKGTLENEENRVCAETVFIESQDDLCKYEEITKEIAEQYLNK